MRKIGFGIIGAGMIAEYHAHSIKSLDNVELIGFFDTNLEAAKKRAAEFNCRVYQSLEELLSDPDPVLTDFYRVFPYFDAIVTVKVTGGEFAAILRDFARFAHKRKQYLAKSGFSADIRRGKVQNIGTVIPKKSYTLALTAYAAAGAGGNLMEVKRILKDNIDYTQSEKSPSLLEILTEQQR